MKKLRIQWIVIVLIIAILPLGAWANTVESLQTEKQNIHGRMQELKAKIADYGVETEVVKGEIAALDADINEATSQIAAVQEQLDSMMAEITVLEREVRQAEIEISEKNELLGKRLRCMYMNGEVTYLDILLSSASFDDMLTRRDIVQRMVEEDRELIAFMQEQMATVEEGKVDLQTKKAAVEQMKSDMEVKRAELETANQKKMAYMAELESNIVLAEEQYDQLEALSRDISQQILELQSVNTTYTGGALAWPLPGHSYISSPYGYRIHPIFNTRKFHSGIDVPAPSGVPVRAAGSGKVISSGWMGGYGNVVMIDHGGGIVTLYAHNSALNVGVGQEVSVGDTVSFVGSTGYSTGPHLHFEVRQNGSTTDPMGWLQ